MCFAVYSEICNFSNRLSKKVKKKSGRDYHRQRCADGGCDGSDYEVVFFDCYSFILTLMNTLEVHLLLLYTQR